MTGFSKIALPSRLENLYKFFEFATSFALQHGFGDKILQNVDLCLEKSLVNIFSYAYKNEEGTAAVECSFEDGR
jgi:anti-sigma regulatory factor (Ser/Thr protein kinase)